MVTDDYVYVNAAEGDGTDVSNFHGNIRTRFYRFEKSKLTPQPWSAATVADMGFTKSLEITKQPDTVKYAYGDIFSLEGIEVTATTLAGTKNILTYKDLTIFQDVDMYTLGKQTLELYTKNLMKVNLDIEIANSYAVTWEISEGGTVDPLPDSLLEGDTPEFTLLPDDGYKASQVLVNGETVSIKKNKFTLPAVTGDLTIQATFEESIFSAGGTW